MCCFFLIAHSFRFEALKKENIFSQQKTDDIATDSSFKN